MNRFSNASTYRNISLVPHPSTVRRSNAPFSCSTCTVTSVNTPRTLDLSITPSRALHAKPLRQHLLLSLLFPQPLLLFRRPRLELQRMNAAFLRELVLEQGVHHTVPRGLHPGFFELFRCYDHAWDGTSVSSLLRLVLQGGDWDSPEVCLGGVS